MAFRLLSSSFSEETLYSLLAPCTRVIKKLGTLRIARAGEGMQNGAMGVIYNSVELVGQIGQKKKDREGRPRKGCYGETRVAKVRHEQVVILRVSSDGDG